MRVGGNGLALLSALFLLPILLHAQSQPQSPPKLPAQPPAQSLLINARDAFTWTDVEADNQSDGGANVIQLAGPVRIQMDRITLSAANAVVWLEDVRGGQANEQSVTIALLGNAEIQQPGVTRGGDRLLFSASVNGPIRITAESKLGRDMSETREFLAANALRREGAAEINGEPFIPTPVNPSTRPTTGPAAKAEKNTSPITYRAALIEPFVDSEGKMALALSGGIAITGIGPDGTLLEMQAERAVLFTALWRLRDIKDMKQIQEIEEAITAGYLEGDVRIVATPPAGSTKSEQRLEANRVYYEFLTDRAILTDAVIHTVEPELQIPVIVRAEAVRQLSQGEYRAKKAELSFSSFAVPTYSVRVDKVYIRQEDTNNASQGSRITFEGNDVTLRAFGVPFFYLPGIGGAVTEKGNVLRGLNFGQSSIFGTSVESRWGLIEALGMVPSPNLDITLKADYFSERGPATGIDATYSGGFISETTKKAWNFEGNVSSYFVYDHGTDDLGGQREPVEPPNEFRGYAAWQHQHFFPEDWQLQLSAAWVSDATFLQQWYQRDFNNQLPLETSLYLKRQRDTEAVTFLVTGQPNNFVTTADLLQEQFEVERLPELGYHRIGDSLAGDKLTFFSDNSLSALRFQESGTSLTDQGFNFANNVRPGQPSLGRAGDSGLAGPPTVTEDYTGRADLRQEIDYPLSLGQFRVVPYVMGRYVGYTDSPDNGGINRGFVGAGVRINTSFWKVDNTAESELFDIHRVRHIIEPGVQLFTSASNVDPSKLWIYDENVDDIHDISAAQIALRQRWQTKRGGPGNERSVDFFTFNVEANFFANQPSQAELQPTGFRGLFFSSLPEASIARNSINANASWRISDTMVALSDMQYNLDQYELATISIGVVAKRDARLAYFVGLRYIEELNSDIATFAATYQLTTKYSFGIVQSYDFGDSGNVYSSISFQRKFDRFFCLLTVYNNSADNDSGISFGLFPEGLGAGVSTDSLQNSFAGGR